MPIEPQQLSPRSRPEPVRAGNPPARPAQESFDEVYRGVTSQARAREERETQRSDAASRHDDARAAQADRDKLRGDRRDADKAGEAQSTLKQADRATADRARSDRAQETRNQASEAQAERGEAKRAAEATAAAETEPKAVDSAATAAAPESSAPVPAGTAAAQPQTTGEAPSPGDVAPAQATAEPAPAIDPTGLFPAAGESSATAPGEPLPQSETQMVAAASEAVANGTTAATSLAAVASAGAAVAAVQGRGQGSASAPGDAIASVGTAPAPTPVATGAAAGKEPGEPVAAPAAGSLPPADPSVGTPTGGETKQTLSTGMEATAARPGEATQPKLDIGTTPISPGADASAKLLTAETAASAAQTAAGASRSGEVAATLQALPVEIGMRALKGNTEFTIRLDPAELGRVEVKLAIDEEGGVTAKLTADRVETLQLLQRDARTLERAFDQAGLKTSPETLQFSLRNDNSGGRGQHAHQDHQPSPPRREEADPIQLPAEALVARYGLRSPTGVDIRI